MNGEQYLVQRTLNNNVVIATNPAGEEEILVGKGLGFGMKAGARLDVDDFRIDKRFRLVQADNLQKFRKLYTVVQPEVIGVAEEIIARASCKLGAPLHEHIHVALPDHIGFSLTRLQGGLDIENPFLHEIRTMYPVTWKLAEEGARLIERRFRIPIPDSEIGFLTLHLHAAAQPQGLSSTIRATEAVARAVEELERISGAVIPRDTLDYARFVTHLRFAVQRLIQREAIVNPLAAAIRERLPVQYRYAEAVAQVVEGYLPVQFPEDEIAYLAMHLARVMRAEA